MYAEKEGGKGEGRREEGRRRMKEGGEGRREGKEGGRGRKEGGEGGLYHADLKDTSSSSVTSHSLEYFECFMKVALSLWRLS